MDKRKPQSIGLVFLGRGDGIATYTLNLAAALSTKMDVYIYIASSNPLIDRYKQAGCKVRTFYTYKNNLASLLLSFIFRNRIKKISTALNQDRPEVVLETGISLWRKLIRKKVSYSPLWGTVIHDPNPHPDRWYWLTKIMYALNKMDTDFYVGISDYSFTAMKSIYRHDRLIRSKIGSLDSTTDLQEDQLINNACHNRHKLLFIGRIEEYKGVSTLVDAFELAKSSNPELALTIAGRGVISSEIASKIVKNQIDLINKWVPQQELNALLNTHGILVLPYSSATQSGPASIAISRGIPSVATNVGALPEQIKHGVNGIIVPPNDSKALANALVQITRNEDTVKQMSEAALELSRNEYSWENIANNLFSEISDVYLSLRRAQ
ncbi:MAG TPA: hypothetical protein DD827_07905 [Gammaproteobacteria bacterium]|jgi:glycosyltransferase involved in cell wall biosynthesis|nr:hypothetical protein [Gammaproteobacteria bacterium]